MTSSVDCLDYIVQKWEDHPNYHSQYAAPTLGRKTPRFKERDKLRCQAAANHKKVKQLRSHRS